MIERRYRSKCCNAEVKTHGVPDFIGSKEICTVSFICRKCKNPCDIIGKLFLLRPKSQKKKVRAVEKSETTTTLREHRKISAAKKRIQAQKKRLDFQGKILQKLVEFFDGITIHPTKGVILTPKKKRQLAELQKMEQKLSKSKAN